MRVASGDLAAGSMAHGLSAGTQLQFVCFGNNVEPAMALAYVASVDEIGIQHTFTGAKT